MICRKMKWTLNVIFYKVWNPGNTSYQYSANEKQKGRDELLRRQGLRGLLLLLFRVARPRQPEPSEALQVPCKASNLLCAVPYTIQTNQHRCQLCQQYKFVVGYKFNESRIKMLLQQKTTIKKNVAGNRPIKKVCNKLLCNYLTGANIRGTRAT